MGVTVVSGEKWIGNLSGEDLEALFTLSAGASCSLSAA